MINNDERYYNRGAIFAVIPVFYKQDDEISLSAQYLHMIVCVRWH